MQIREWLRESSLRLQESDSPKRDAEILLGFVLDKPRSWLIAFDDTELTASQLERLATLVAQRAEGHPVAHLVGQREFWSLPLRVNAHTLIPRPDTEVLVEQALVCLPTQGGQILDLGTGTGAIALALASERPDCTVTGVDRIPQAVALAQENAQALGIDNCQFQLSHWFADLSPCRYQLIVTNPPYIDADDHHLQQGDVRFEPLSALVAADKGLADIQEIIHSARDWLANQAWLVVEHGWQQAESVQQLFTAAGYQQVATRCDYGNNPRITYGQYTLDVMQ